MQQLMVEVRLEGLVRLSNPHSFNIDQYFHTFVVGFPCNQFNLTSVTCELAHHCAMRVRVVSHQ